MWPRNLNKFDIKLTNMFSKWFWSESGPWWRGSSRGPLWAVSNFSRHQKFKGNSCKDYHVNNCWDQVVVLRWWHWTVSLGSRTLVLEGCCENTKIQISGVLCVTRMKRVFEWPWLRVRVWMSMMFFSKCWYSWEKTDYIVCPKLTREQLERYSPNMTQIWHLA